METPGVPLEVPETVTGMLNVPAISFTVSLLVLNCTAPAAAR